MAGRYDAIVIGAGLGGLASAATLAKNGLNVLLLERHHQPGGYASTFVRGRFEFEIALHQMSGLNLKEKSGLCLFLEELGIMDRVKFVSLEDIYRAVFPDIDITIPANREAAEGILIDNFPKESDGIKKILDLSFNTGYAIDYLQTGKPKMTQEQLQEYLLTKMDKTWGEVVNSYVKDEKLRAVLSVYWPYFGLPPSKISYVLFAIALSSYIGNGPKQIFGKSAMLSGAFVDVIEKNGGDVRLGCGVKQILTEGGKVKGVITEKGEKIYSDYIISNVNPISAAVNLIGKDKVPESFLERIRSSEISTSLVTAYMGMDASCKELGVDDFEIWYYNTYNHDQVYESRKKLNDTDLLLLTAYNKGDPNFSPPGTSVIVLSVLSDPEPWYSTPPSKYVETKNKYAEMLIEKAEKHIPRLRDHIEVIEVATPITLMRYSGNPGGTYLGFTYSVKDGPLSRLSNEGPIKGLYFAGAWTQPGGGYEPCITSGRWAAEKVIKEIKNK
jgi:prolycopene isomerase